MHVVFRHNVYSIDYTVKCKHNLYMHQEAKKTVTHLIAIFALLQCIHNISDEVFLCY